jgi:REP element-mobilizing transposase RayT
MYNPANHHRKSIRCKNYNYASKGAYFLTLNLKERLPILGEIENQNLDQNLIGKLVEEAWLMTPKVRPNIKLGAYILMPDHFHAIIHINEEKKRPALNKLTKKDNTNISEDSITTQNNYSENFKSPSQTIGAIVRGFKGSSTKLIKELIYKLEENKKLFEESKNSKLELQHPNKIDKITITKTEIEEIEPLIKKIDLTKSIWQRDYYDIIIRNNESLERITQYIINNPKNAQRKA